MMRENREHSKTRRSRSVLSARVPESIRPKVFICLESWFDNQTISFIRVRHDHHSVTIFDINAEIAGPSDVTTGVSNEYGTVGHVLDKASKPGIERRRYLGILRSDLNIPGAFEESRIPWGAKNQPEGISVTGVSLIDFRRRILAMISHP